MKKVFLVGLILFVSLIAGCIVPPDPDPVIETPISFNEIESGKMSGITQKTYFVVNNEKEWKELYLKIHNEKCGLEDSECSIRTIPKVDFKKYTVVAVFMGEQPNQDYRIEIQKVTSSQKQVKVYANEINEEHNPDLMIPLFTVQPYEIIQIPKTALHVIVQRKKVIIPWIEQKPISIDFSVVDSGTQSGVKKESLFTANTVKELQDLYEKIYQWTDNDLNCLTNSNGSSVPDANCSIAHTIPAIDMSKYTVIGVFSGELPNPNYSMKVDSVARKNKQIVVYAQRLYTVPDPGTSTTPVTVSPFVVIKIPKTSLPVIAVWSSSKIALTLEQAIEIAENSECAEQGTINSENTAYNDNSNTFWFDFTPNNPIEGCNPACVVSEETRTAEINWMCTGLLPVE